MSKRSIRLVHTGFFRRLFFRKLVIIGTIGFAFFLMVAIFAPLIATHNPNEMDAYNRLTGINSSHWLGTDMYGRDLYSRLVYGTRVSLIIGVLTVLISGVVGTFLGGLAAYVGGIVDNVLMRLCEAMRAIPQIAISMALLAIYGGGIQNMAIILSIACLPGYIRIARSAALNIRGKDYVLSAKLQGETVWQLLCLHVLPNSISPIIVMATQQIGGTIMMEAGLSFLGIGISVPTASWGSIVNEARTYLITNPLYTLAPCVCIALLVICMNVLGDGVRDALDPSLRGEVR